MATEDQDIEVPLFVGINEGKDSQLRREEAVVSENVTFGKTGSIGTRPYLDAFAETPSDVLGVFSSGADIFSYDTSNLYASGGASSLSTVAPFTSPLSEDSETLEFSGHSVGQIRVHDFTDSYLMTWSENQGNSEYAILGAFYNKVDFRRTSAVVTLVSDCYQAYSSVKSVLAGGLPGVTILATTRPAADALLTFTNITVNLATGDPLFSSSDLAITRAGSIPGGQSLSLISTNADLVVASVAFATGVNPHRSDTYVITYQPDTGTTNSLLVSPGAAETTHGGSRLHSLGYDADTDEIWFASSASNVGDGVYTSLVTTPAAVPTMGTAVLLDAVYPSYGYTSLSSEYVEEGTGRFLFDSGERWFVMSSFNEEAPMAYTVAYELPAAPAAYVSSAFSPGCNLAGDPVVLNGSLAFPLTLMGSWGKVLNGENKDSEFFAEDSRDDPPRYYCGAVGTVVGGKVTAGSLFAFDELRHQSDNANALTGHEGVLSPNGSSVMYEGALRFFHPRRVANEGIPQDGTGGRVTGGNPIYWAHSPVVSTFQTQSNPHATSSLDTVVVSLGFMGIQNRNSVFPAAFPVPPSFFPIRLNIVDPVGWERKYKLLWAWRDSDGVYHRGPPSREYHYIHYLTGAVAVSTAKVPPLANLPGVDISRCVLEVYAEPVISGAVTPGNFILVDRITDVSASGPNDFVEVDLTDDDSAPTAPLLYTTGGVLPNELQPSSGPSVFAKGRVWGYSNGKVFFSNQVSQRLPMSFNANLYVDSPDGADFTGIASLDEQVILFTRLGVHTARGPGVNRLGSGPGFQLGSITSPSGCISQTSVVETPYGVVFLGDAGLYLLLRNLSVQFLTEVEDSLYDADVHSGTFDRDTNELVIVSSAGNFVFNFEADLWTKVDITRTVPQLAVWTPRGLVAAAGGQLSGGNFTAITTEPQNSYAPLLHSTPWVTVGSAEASGTNQSYQRVKRLTVQGNVTVGNVWDTGTEAEGSVDRRAQLIVRVYQDHDDTPVYEQYHDMTVFNGKFELPFHCPRQKCKVFRVEFETPEANMDLTITSVVASVGRKMGPFKTRDNA